MPENLTSIIQNPYLKRNLDLLLDVEFKDNQEELKNSDDHIIRGYCITLDKDYAELKDLFKQINSQNIVNDFCIKILPQNAEVKGIVSSPLLKESEQLRLCAVFHKRRFNSAPEFIKHICEKTEFINELNKQKNQNPNKSFEQISKLEKSNSLGQALKQEIRIYEFKNQQGRKM